MAVSSPEWACSFAITASFIAYMQQTAEQYELSHWFTFRDPTHWSHAILCGSSRS